MNGVKVVMLTLVLYGGGVLCGVLAERIHGRVLYDRQKCDDLIANASASGFSAILDIEKLDEKQYEEIRQAYCRQIESSLHVMRELMNDADAQERSDKYRSSIEALEAFLVSQNEPGGPKAGRPRVGRPRVRP